MEKKTLFDTDISRWRGSLANRVLKLFCDSNGNIVIAQPPNLPIEEYLIIEVIVLVN